MGACGRRTQALLLRAEADGSFADAVTGHEELAALSSIGIRRLVPDAGHYIQNDDPDIVIGAISEVVAASRRR